MSVYGELEQISRFLNGIGHHAYICLDKAGRVVSSTRMAQDIAGLTATEAHGRLFTHMLPRVADGQESLDTMVLEGLFNPGQKFTDLRRRYSQSGRSMWLEVTIERLDGAQVTGITYGMSLIDVSERQHVEAHPSARESAHAPCGRGDGRARPLATGSGDAENAVVQRRLFDPRLR